MTCYYTHPFLFYFSSDKARIRKRTYFVATFKQDTHSIKPEDLLEKVWLHVFWIKNIAGACKEHTSPRDEQKLTSLVAAAELGHILCIEKLLKAGVDMNAVDGNGYSALIQATENNFKDIVWILL